MLGQQSPDELAALRRIANLYHEFAADQSWSPCRRALAQAASVALDRIARLAVCDDWVDDPRGLIEVSILDMSRTALAVYELLSDPAGEDEYLDVAS